MRYGIELVPFGEYANPRQVIEIARAAENFGWEALVLWDHVLMPWGAGDPWISLAAVATATQKIKLITGVAPLPRYKPHLLARTLTALDLLSNGRVILGTGLGVAFDFVPFGEPGDDKVRAEMADEGLELLSRYLSGEEVTHHGVHYTADAARLVPSPVQQPRIPFWIGGASKPALRRAAHWDGWIMGTINEQMETTYTPEQIAADVAYIQSHRTETTPFDIAVDGASEPGKKALAREYEQAGATWWFECIFGTRGTHEEMLQRISAGPPST